MDSLYFDVLKLGYHLALAVLVGGGLVLGAAAAPAIFRGARSRGEGGAIFGAVLERYDGLAILALMVIGVTSALRIASFEELAGPVVARLVALAVMALGTLYASAWANPIARGLRAETRDWDDLPEDAVVRREFAALHAGSRRAMSIALLAGVVAFFLS